MLNAHLWDECIDDLMVDFQTAIYARSGSLKMPSERRYSDMSSVNARFDGHMG